jgi:type IV pilus assembly protein PilY1
VIAFATGKLFENIDISATTPQSIYGVLDNIPFGSPTTAISTVGLSNLIEQTIGFAGTLTKTVTNADFTTSTKIVSFYKISQNTVTFSTSVNGWYINLTETGQRNVYPVESVVDNYIAVDTISPNNVVSSNACTQGLQGNGWLYLIDGLTGGGSPQPILDTNGDGAINSSDALSNGISTPADGRNIITTIESRTNDRQTTVAILGGTDESTQAQIPKPKSSSGGSIKQREWRQLFMR